VQSKHTLDELTWCAIYGMEEIMQKHKRDSFLSTQQEIIFAHFLFSFSLSKSRWHFKVTSEHDIKKEHYSNDIFTTKSKLRLYISALVEWNAFHMDACNIWLN